MKSKHLFHCPKIFLVSLCAFWMLCGREGYATLESRNLWYQLAQQWGQVDPGNGVVRLGASMLPPEFQAGLSLLKIRHIQKLDSLTEGSKKGSKSLPDLYEDLTGTMKPPLQSESDMRQVLVQILAELIEWHASEFFAIKMDTSHCHNDFFGTGFFVWALSGSPSRQTFKIFIMQSLSADTYDEAAYKQDLAEYRKNLIPFLNSSPVVRTLSERCHEWNERSWSDLLVAIRMESLKNRNQSFFKELVKSLKTRLDKESGQCIKDCLRNLSSALRKSADSDLESRFIRLQSKSLLSNIPLPDSL